MTEGFEGQTPAISDPDMKVVLESDADEPQVLMEWTTTHWAGQPNPTYHIDGAAYEAKGVREDQEADGTVVYRVTVVRAEETS